MYDEPFSSMLSFMRGVSCNRGIKQRVTNLHISTMEWVDACDISVP